MYINVQSVFCTVALRRWTTHFSMSRCCFCSVKRRAQISAAFCWWAWTCLDHWYSSSARYKPNFMDIKLEASRDVQNTWCMTSLIMVQSIPWFGCKQRFPIRRRLDIVGICHRRSFMRLFRCHDLNMPCTSMYWVCLSFGGLCSRRCPESHLHICEGQKVSCLQQCHQRTIRHTGSWTEFKEHWKIFRARQCLFIFSFYPASRDAKWRLTYYV